MLTRDPARPFKGISPEEYITTPVWEMALEGEEGNPEQDESWRRPLLGVNDLTDELGTVYCTLRVAGTEAVATALWDPSEDALFEMMIWHEGEWAPLNRVKGLPSPLVFEMVCKVHGTPGARYTSAAGSGFEAVRLKDRADAI